MATSSHKRQPKRADRRTHDFAHRRTQAPSRSVFNPTGLKGVIGNGKAKTAHANHPSFTLSGEMAGGGVAPGANHLWRDPFTKRQTLQSDRSERQAASHRATLLRVSALTRSFVSAGWSKSLAGPLSPGFDVPRLRFPTPCSYGKPLLWLVFAWTSDRLAEVSRPCADEKSKCDLNELGKRAA